MAERQLPFSERMGLVQPRSTFQTDEISSDLRSRLFNCFSFCVPKLREGFPQSPTAFLATLWDGFFKQSVTNIEIAEQEIRSLFGSGTWFRVYELLEFTRNGCPWQSAARIQFTARCNQVLEEELSGFRFVNGLIAPIVSPEEIEAIETAIANRIPPARKHLVKALELLSARTNPNYAKSIQESISAVEAQARDITGKADATLGSALAAMKKGKMPYHPEFLEAVRLLYHWTCDDGGVRHADKPGADVPDRATAKFSLVACSAIVNYLEELRAR